MTTNDFKFNRNYVTDKMDINYCKSIFLNPIDPLETHKFISSLITPNLYVLMI